MLLRGDETTGTLSPDECIISNPKAQETIAAWAKHYPVYVYFRSSHSDKNSAANAEKCFSSELGSQYQIYFKDLDYMRFENNQINTFKDDFILEYRVPRFYSDLMKLIISVDILNKNTQINTVIYADLSIQPQDKDFVKKAKKHSIVKNNDIPMLFIERKPNKYGNSLHVLSRNQNMISALDLFINCMIHQHTYVSGIDQAYTHFCNANQKNSETSHVEDQLEWLLLFYYLINGDLESYNIDITSNKSITYRDGLLFLPKNTYANIHSSDYNNCSGLLLMMINKRGYPSKFDWSDAKWSNPYIQDITNNAKVKNLEKFYELPFMPLIKLNALDNQSNSTAKKSENHEPVANISEDILVGIDPVREKIAAELIVWGVSDTIIINATKLTPERVSELRRLINP